MWRSAETLALFCSFGDRHQRYVGFSKAIPVNVGRRPKGRRLWFAVGEPRHFGARLSILFRRGWIAYHERPSGVT